MRRPERTFLDTPFAPTLAAGAADVVVFGAAQGTPYRPGTASHAADAPAAIRGALGWYSAAREQYDWDLEDEVMGRARVLDHGDVPGDLEIGAANRAAIRAATERILAAGAVPILIGGDDSTPIPFLEAFCARERPVTVVQIDAHIDWRDEVDGVREGFSSTMRRASEMDHVAGMVQIGARGPGSARRRDRTEAEAWGAQIFPMRRLHAKGFGGALAAIPRDADIVLDLDVDGLDPALVPGVVLPAFGGLTYHQALDVIAAATAGGRLVGATVVEYVPDRDPSGIGARAIARLIACLIGLLSKSAGD